MYMMQGEVREVGIEVTNKLEQDFVIAEASYQVIKHEGTDIETGQPIIDGHKLIVLFSANETGKYSIIFTYVIGVETLKSKIYVEVN